MTVCTRLSTPVFPGLLSGNVDLDHTRPAIFLAPYDFIFALQIRAGAAEAVLTTSLQPPMKLYRN